MALIRAGQPADTCRVREVNLLAFGQPDEGDLVERLRERCRELLELVAVRDGKVVGHILFSPATVSCQERTVKGAALGPMAVLPAYQGQGIGSALVRRGVAMLREQGCPFVVVLGYPEFYGRLGFGPASRFGVDCDWDVPDAAFMMLILADEAMRGMSGRAQYRPEFSQV